MGIKKDGEIYLVESSSKGKTYQVDLKKNSCTCPQYLFRARRTGTDCKHLAAVKQMVMKSADKFGDVLDYVKENVFVDSMELIEKFGEKAVDSLISQGELIEEHGKVRLI